MVEQASGSDRGAVYTEGSATAAVPAGVSAGQSTQLDEHLHDTEPPLAKVLRKPYQPTQEEIDSHLPNHLPYRSWCRACVAGRGKNDWHRELELEDKAVAEIVCDYCFMGKKTDVDKADGETLG